VIRGGYRFAIPENASKQKAGASDSIGTDPALVGAARRERNNLGSNVSTLPGLYRDNDPGYSLFCKETAIKPSKAPSPPFHVTDHAEAAHWAAPASLRRAGLRAQRPQKECQMSHAYQLNAAVLHRGQGPQGRVQIEEPKVYTIIQRMPVESDGRIRYRIKSDKIERIVTEDELSYCQ
jgi:hypothetical protein